MMIANTAITSLNGIISERDNRYSTSTAVNRLHLIPDQAVRSLIASLTEDERAAGFVCLFVVRLEEVDYFLNRFFVPIHRSDDFDGQLSR